MHGFCPVRVKTARSRSAELGFALWLQTSGQGIVQTYLAKSAAGRRVRSLTAPRPGNK
jgi:hypothetical protein